MSKVMAIIDEPKSCKRCFFNVCKFSNPFWCKENPNTKGYYCQIMKDKNVITVDYDCEEFKQPNCPLKPYKAGGIDE